jgi:hypothetical protein
MILFQYTCMPCVAGARVVHALYGGGAVLPGRYLKGMTWCGVERHSRVLLVETEAEPTCRACLRALAAHNKKEKAT